MCVFMGDVMIFSSLCKFLWSLILWMGENLMILWEWVVLIGEWYLGFVVFGCLVWLMIGIDLFVMF